MTKAEANKKISEIRNNYKGYIEGFRTLSPTSSGTKSLEAFNLISELHLDNKNMYENAHTRVLAAILRFDNRFLESFLERCGIKHTHVRINGRIDIDVERSYTKKSDQWYRSSSRIKEENTNKCRPDCLIWKGDQFAIIIENKINGAPETENQVDNYINAISGGNDIKLKNNYYIWVIYLGGDTEDMPSSYSLRDSGILFVRGADDSRHSGSHLRLVSYKNVIIPWLEEDVLPICPYGMSNLTGGLLVYIDYLKKRFEDSSSEEKIFYDSINVVSYFQDIEEPSNNLFPRLYNDAKVFVSLAEENDPDIVFFKALKHYYLNHHFRFNKNAFYKDWTIYTAGSNVYVWKNSWYVNQTKSHSICDLFFELFAYQIDSYMSNPDKFRESRQVVTCSLKYKGKDECMKDYLTSKGIMIGDHVFNKEAQMRERRQLCLKDGSFFDSFVQDRTIKALCTNIDALIKEYKEANITSQDNNTPFPPQLDPKLS